MENLKSSCNCNGKGELIVLSCSGASDVGQLTDLVARRLRDNNQRTMKCLAMVASDNQQLIESLKTSNVLVLDGCPVDCGKKILEKVGITNYNYIRLSDWNYHKGKSPVTKENIHELYEKTLMYY